MIDVLPPKIIPDINTKIRLRVLAGVIYEMATICGVDIGDDLNKGIIERDVIERITLTFKDDKDKGHGKIIFLINWEKLEVLARTDKGEELYKGIDFSNGLCNQLDPRLLEVLKVHVNKLRESYGITSVHCSFFYRDKYNNTDSIHNATRKYMGHVPGKHIDMMQDEKFVKSLRTAFKGMDGILDVIFEFD